MKTIFSIGVLFVVVIALIIAGPFASIAALNTLFSLTIPYTIWTWLSMLWLQMLLVAKYKHNA